ncbi:hypothetical protein F5Y18DRAFT_181379 [Xylariaceae sp. FL1019]|nr:hypothetical protein F5Y18DRAFT_181379 [Xylariaceae sp. FL1019]
MGSNLYGALSHEAFCLHRWLDNCGLTFFDARLAIILCCLGGGTFLHPIQHRLRIHESIEPFNHLAILGQNQLVDVLVPVLSRGSRPLCIDIVDKLALRLVDYHVGLRGTVNVEEGNGPGLEFRVLIAVLVCGLKRRWECACDEVGSKKGGKASPACHVALRSSGNAPVLQLWRSQCFQR